MTVVQAGFSPGGNCDGENTAQVQTLVWVRYLQG